MDNVILQAMAIELNRTLANSRLDRVIQVSAGTLVLRFWTGRESLQLLLEAEGPGCFYLTRRPHAAPAKPPRFCQLLRARLRRLIEVRAEPLDRIVHFHFIGTGSERYVLVLEAFGGRGNLILNDANDRIVDLLWRQEGARCLLPGEPYQPPDQQRRQSLFGDRGELLALMDAVTDPLAMARLPIAPMSPALARAICSELATGCSLEGVLDRIRQAFADGAFTALRVAWNGQSGLLPLALGRSAFTTCEAATDLSSLLEEPAPDGGRESATDLAARLTGVIARQRKKLARRLETIALESERMADPEKLRIMGDLLLANLRRLKRGAEEVEVDDYYQSPMVRLLIPLDGRLSPHENAERYFKRYRKARRAGEHHLRRLQETEQERAWLDQVELALDEAVTGDDLYQVQCELEAAGLLKDTPGQLGRRPLARPEDQLHRATTPGGWPLCWGRNSRTNDYVSRSMTDPQDLWFHAQGMPGCHLVLKCAGQGDRVADEDLLFAASLAAGYSRGKSAGKVEVMVARGSDVRKPKGARPGLVTVDHYRTVMVTPLRLA